MICLAKAIAMLRQRAIEPFHTPDEQTNSLILMQK